MIELNGQYHPDANNIDLAPEFLKSLPLPIAEIVNHLEINEEPQLRLQELCLSLIPMTFQYLALVLSSEYLYAEVSPDNEVTD